ncbi:MAG: XRE family transcriptional regulator [Steroidobacteraceae bacterium]
MTNSAVGRTVNEVIAGLPAGQRRAVRKRAASLIADELSLRDLRKALGLTQVTLGRKLGKGQYEVSRIEQRGDMLLSTLTGYVEAMGGELELICRFRKRPPVRLRPSSAANSAAGRRGKGRRPAA